MHRITGTRRKPAGAAKAGVVLAILLLTCLGLAACGSSGSSTTTATSANAAATSGSGARTGTVPNGPSGPTGPRLGRFSALRECLQKNGITLPQRTPGQRPPGGFLGGPGSQLPNGVTRAQLRAALKKCGAPFGRLGGARRFGSPVYKRAFARFAACMRENGVNLPEPNTSGKGPVFDTKGLNTNSAQFRAAEAKCRTDLRFAVRPGAAGGG